MRQPSLGSRSGRRHACGRKDLARAANAAFAIAAFVRVFNLGFQRAARAANERGYVMGAPPQAKRHTGEDVSTTGRVGQCAGSKSRYYTPHTLRARVRDTAASEPVIRPRHWLWVRRRLLARPGSQLHTTRLQHTCCAPPALGRCCSRAARGQRQGKDTLCTRQQIWARADDAMR
ncbi:hypothetical protein EJ04DRAFT_76536 [Polyplosphaeria fusca]|uniref:Uncharacterized protein n=1 Tax=Polyplosphaeria fusca TaxID=682080 RepID=A0A9P4UWE3_9PLEO|nr:hypothetical protein EJ04DRAFT_76536 [Polyplosphaeria fusca]